MILSSYLWRHQDTQNVNLSSKLVYHQIPQKLNNIPINLSGTLCLLPCLIMYAPHLFLISNVNIVLAGVCYRVCHKQKQRSEKSRKICIACAAAAMFFPFFFANYLTTPQIHLVIALGVLTPGLNPLTQSTA